MSQYDREQVTSVIDSLAPLLGELEDQRQGALKSRAKGMGFVGLAAVVWLVIAIAVARNAGMFGIILALIGFGVTFAILYSVFIGRQRKKYEGEYKLRVLTEVTKAIQPGMRYSPHQGISESLFKSANLVRSRIDRYHSEDLFYGGVGETEVHFSEVKAERKDTSTDANGHRRTSWKTLFDGVFFMADFHKNFSTWATVTPDFAEKTFGWLGQKLQKLGGDIVRLENPDFEKAFVVRGGDQVAVRYILTPDMQERILQLRAVFGSGVMLSFKNSKVTMLFKTKGNWFEPDFNRPSHDVAQIGKFVTEIQLCCSVVETMNLNTRIWTKD